MSESAVQKVNQIQKNSLKSLAEEFHKCGVCKKNKPKLYVCKYADCPQKNTLLCTRCGTFTHDDDMDHEFNSDYIHVDEVSLNLGTTIQNNSQNQKTIKQNTKEIHLMAKSMEEKKYSAARNTAEITVSYVPLALDLLESVPSFMRNEQYFSKAFSLMGNALKNGELKQFGTSLKTVLYDVGDFSLEATKVCNEGAVIAAGAMFTVEFCYHTFRLIRGDISLKNYGKKIVSSFAMASGAAMGNIGGATVGAAIGTFIFPFVGSAVGGAIGGFLGAIWVGSKAKQSIEEMSWFNDNNEQEFRKQLIKEALGAFGFTWKDITNTNTFNEQSIAKKYKSRAKEAHPDRDGGSHEKFQKLNGQMSILLALLQQDKNIKEETSKNIKAIALH